MVTSPGHAWRLSGNALNAELARSSLLQATLLRYTEALIAQIAQTVVCNRLHALEQRLCRWILLSLDRLSADELTVTHEELADLLGVRRASVTLAIGALQQAGLVDHHRGLIRVLDRAGLEARVCECYAVVKSEYVRLLQPAAGTRAVEGPSPDTVVTRFHIA